MGQVVYMIPIRLLDPWTSQPNCVSEVRRHHPIYFFLLCLTKVGRLGNLTHQCDFDVRRLIINVRFDKFSAENVTIPTLDFQGDKYHWKSIYQDVECYFDSGINCKSIKR